MGTQGEIIILVMIIMAVTSTGSAEVIAVTSILVYDVYQLYLKVSGGITFFPEILCLRSAEENSKLNGVFIAAGVCCIKSISLVGMEQFG